MEGLTGKQLRQVSEFLLDLYQLRTHEEFTSHVIEALPKITDGEFTSYNEFIIGDQKILYKSDQLPYCPDPLHYATVLQQNVHEQPVVTHWLTTQDDSAHIISDFVPSNQFQKTVLYNEFYKPLKMSYILFLGMKTANGRLMSISRHRNDKEFSGSSKSVLNAIRPHLRRALDNSLAVTRIQNELTAMHHAMEQSQQGLISVTEEGSIRFITPHAQELLNRYGLQTRPDDNRFPTRLRDWLTHQQRQLSHSDDVPPELRPLLVEGDLGCLTIRLIVRGSQYLLILEERKRVPVSEDFASLGLSHRESEILAWVTQGKTNPEISMILGISRRTVQKHLERIYIKLGVENRTAAAAIAADAMYASQASLSPRSQELKK